MRRGFTLIELLVVIGVIVLLAGVSMLGYNSWRKDTMRKALTSDLRAALAAMEQEKNFRGAYPTVLPDSYRGNSTNISIYTSPGSSTSSSIICLEGASFNPSMKLHIKSDNQTVSDGPC